MYRLLALVALVALTLLVHVKADCLNEVAGYHGPNERTMAINTSTSILQKLG